MTTYQLPVKHVQRLHSTQKTWMMKRIVHFFGSVNLSHSEEHYNDLLEQEFNLNEDKSEDIY